MADGRQIGVHAVDKSAPTHAVASSQPISGTGRVHTVHACVVGPTGRDRPVRGAHCRVEQSHTRLCPEQRRLKQYDCSNHNESTLGGRPVDRFAAVQMHARLPGLRAQRPLPERGQLLPLRPAPAVCDLLVPSAPNAARTTGAGGQQPRRLRRRRGRRRSVPQLCRGVQGCGRPGGGGGGRRRGAAAAGAAAVLEARFREETPRPGGEAAEGADTEGVPHVGVRGHP